MVVALVQSKVEVIVTHGGAAWSAYRHGGTTPIVFGYSGDPVEAKFVESLARPGGTRTGMSFMALELVGKRLEVLAQILPVGARVAVIAHPEHPGEQNELRHSQIAAQDLWLKLRYFPVRTAEDIDAAFKSISSEGVQAIVVFPDAFTLDQRERIAAFGLKSRLPTVSGWRPYAESGFLMSYGPNLRISYAHLATYVDKILKGAKPADLPVELPTAVEFVINARTAKAIGVRIPQPMFVRADKVIDWPAEAVERAFLSPGSADCNDPCRSVVDIATAASERGSASHRHGLKAAPPARRTSGSPTISQVV